MAKRKRKLTAEQRRAKRRRRREYQTIFINGKKKRVKRPPTIDELTLEEIIRRNADPIWLHQEELWEYLQPPADEDNDEPRPFSEPF